jgi:hypothetical protein
VHASRCAPVRSFLDLHLLQFRAQFINLPHSGGGYEFFQIFAAGQFQEPFFNFALLDDQLGFGSGSVFQGMQHPGLGNAGFGAQTMQFGFTLPDCSGRGVEVLFQLPRFLAQGFLPAGMFLFGIQLGVELSDDLQGVGLG